MILAKEILKQARYTLSDLSKDRYSDERLLALLDQGVKDIAKNTTIFVEFSYIVIANNVVDYDFSPIATKIVRVEYLDQPVDFKTYADMDRNGRLWQHEVGDRPKAFVVDNHKRAYVKMYPIVNNAYNPYITYSSLYGITTDISYTDILPVMEDHYGDIGSIPAQALLKLFYVRKHEDIIDINQEVIIDELCKEPLAHYIAGRALRDNQDTQNRAMAAEEMQFYYNLVNEFSVQKEANFANVKRETVYRPLG